MIIKISKWERALRLKFSKSLVLTVIVTIACVQDRDGARHVLGQLRGFCKKLRPIWVDGAYRGEHLDRVSKHFEFRLEPVLRFARQNVAMTFW